VVSTEVEPIARLEPHGRAGAARQRTAVPAQKFSRAHTEGFRLLALNLHRMLEGDGPASILVLSANRKEGRSMAAMSLGQVLAEIAPPVVIIDADPDGSGSDGLRAEARDELWMPGIGDSDEPPALQVVAPWFRSGTQDNFLESVQSALDEAAAMGATVIIDGPACTASSTSFYLATKVTGVLYVARRRKIGPAVVHSDIRAQLELLGVRVLGVVVNEG